MSGGKGFPKGHKLRAKVVDHLSVLPAQDQELVHELISDLLGEGGDGFRNVFGWMNCLQGGCIGFVTEMVT